MAPYNGRHTDSRNRRQSLVFDLLLTGVCRLVLNTARRFAYPFAPALSRAMGVPLTHITSMIAVNQASGLLALFFGPFADRLGYGFMMLLGLFLLAVGMLAAASLPFFAVVLIALFLAGLGKNIFDPAIQAYVGERVPYEKRGLAIGLIETSWAASTLIGIPLVGLLITWQGWRAPFAAMGIAALGGMVLIALRLPPESTAHRSIRHRRLPLRLGTSLSKPNRAHHAGAGLSGQHGQRWRLCHLRRLVGEKFSSERHPIGIGQQRDRHRRIVRRIYDRGVGRPHGQATRSSHGIGLSLIAYITLPWTAISLPFALTGLFALFIAVEFTFVTALSMATEILPDQRAT